MISWPCMLKLDGDDELIYLDSFEKFSLECSALIFTDDDYVIDASGNCYLMKFTSGKLDLIAQDKTLSTNEAVNLIRAHEFNKVSVCLTKINFLTVSEAIHSLNY